MSTKSIDKLKGVFTMTKDEGRRKTRQGIVVSDKMDKTVVVRIERLTRHPQYNRVVKRAKKFKAHDEHNQCSIGDIVEIMETRPLSKEKRWRVTKIVRKAEV
jgi:small subunit ribosomal protein S17